MERVRDEEGKEERESDIDNQREIEGEVIREIKIGEGELGKT